MTTREQLAPVAARMTRDPIYTIEMVFGTRLWSKQRDVVESVWRNKRTAVRSGNTVGKTRAAAACALSFLYGKTPSRVITTAPTDRQVEHLLWRDIRSMIANRPGRDAFDLPGRILTKRLELAEDWFAIGYSAKDTDPEAFAGQHGENILFIVDEASGVAEPIYEAIEGSLNSEGVRLLLLGNPTRPSGEFHRAFHTSRDLYERFHISAFDTPNFTGEDVPAAVRRGLVRREWVEERRHVWGEDSPIYQVRVLGEFPRQGDDTVVSLGDLEDAQTRELEPGEPVIVSCDVARFGSDDTVIAVRKGRWVRIVESYNGRDTMQTAGHIKRVADDVGAAKVVVDDVGVGGGVVDRLREQRPVYAVESFGGGEKARDSEHYPNRRSEAWFSFAEQLPSIDLDADEQLAADLLAPRYKTDSAGRLVVEQKSETKRRLGRSPDRADAVLMAFSVTTDVASVVVPSRRLQTRIVSGGSGW